MMKNGRNARIWLIVGVLILALIAISYLELSWAPRKLTASEVWAVIVGSDVTFNDVIVLKINAPRVALGFFVGGALGVAGAVMQAMFRNPMASPYILGLSSGASLGAAIAMLFTISFIPYLIAVPLLAFVFCMMTMFFVYSVARVGSETHMETLLLAGIAISALLQAMVSLLTFIAGDKLDSVVFWGMGSLSGSKWNEIFAIIPIISLSFVIMAAYAKDLNAMMMGDVHAMDLGVDVKKVRLILLIASSLITAAAVCFAGTIGFVGLIIPHILRILTGPDNRSLIPLSFLAGGVYLILCDYLAHVIYPSMGVLPIGVITALIGAPYFVYLLRRRKTEMGW